MAHDTEQLWRELRDRLQAFIARRVDNPADVEDLLQDVFLRIHQHLSTVRDTGRLIPWIFQLARNVITDYYRAAARRREMPGQPGHDHEEESEAHAAVPALNSDEQASHQYELAPCLMPLLDRLPEHYREAVYLVEMEGLPQRELSERLAVSLSGAKSRVQRGRDKLKELLLQCCQVELDKRGNVMDYQPEAAECGAAASATTARVISSTSSSCPCARPKEGRHEQSTL